MLYLKKSRDPLKSKFFLSYGSVLRSESAKILLRVQQNTQKPKYLQKKTNFRQSFPVCQKQKMHCV